MMLGAPKTLHGFLYKRAGIPLKTSVALYGMEVEFYGVQDEYISKLIPATQEGSYERTSKYTYTGKELCFSTPEAAEGGYAYSNLRLKGDPMTIQSAELLIGGQRVDKIYPEITGQMSFSIFGTNNLPALKAHEYKLYINHTGDVEVHVDELKLTEPFKEGEILFTATQYNGAAKLTSGLNKVRLYFNHPVKSISVFGDCRCIELNLDGLVIPATTDRTFVFAKTLNFSRVDKVILVVETQTDGGTVHTFAESLNVARMTDEMFGVRFSK